MRERKREIDRVGEIEECLVRERDDLERDVKTKKGRVLLGWYFAHILETSMIHLLGLF